MASVSLELADLWAKSSTRKGERGESLATHTLAVLQRYEAWRQFLPHWPTLCGDSQLWPRLRLACLFHDLGKAASGFQSQVRPDGSPWGQRHEVLSLAFLDWAIPFSTDLSDDYVWVAAAIVTHHRDLDWIQRKYDERPSDDVEDPSSLRWLVDELTPLAIAQVAEWLGQQCQSLDLSLQIPADPAADILTQGRLRIIRCLALLRRLTADLRSQPVELRLRSLAYRGFLVLADHCASAGMNPVALDQCTPSCMRKELGLEDIYQHQQQLAEVRGNAILLAPTGSGKTEASLLWLEQQLSQVPTGRFFYVLPFQASLNAMFDRLCKIFSGGAVGLHHSRAIHALYRRILEQGYGEKQAARMARFSANLGRLHAQPARLLTPYQLLTAAFRLKGHECLLTDAAGSLLVFDEIHVYEVSRLAMLVEFIRFLVQTLGCRCLVMSATLPALLREVLTPVLQAQVVRAEPKLLQAFTRHRVDVRAGHLEYALDEMCAEYRRGSAVLVVCNTVDTAISIYRKLFDQLNEPSGLELLHGRFTPRDRLSKETALMKRLGTRSRNRDLGGAILVATQVVEVSLDVDFDILFSEPAPLEALLQRFGRVNRGRTQAACPVIVFDTPSSPNDVYQEQSLLVERALQVLRSNNGELLLESDVEGWLDEVYAEPVRSQWLQEFDAAASEFRAACLDTMVGFNADSQLREQFYRMFDGIDVLPEGLVQEYQSLLETQPLRSGELLVNLRWGQYCALKNRGLVAELDALEDTRIVKLPYSAQYGLLLRPHEA